MWEESRNRKELDIWIKVRLAGRQGGRIDVPEEAWNHPNGFIGITWDHSRGPCEAME